MHWLNWKPESSSFRARNDLTKDADRRTLRSAFASSERRENMKMNRKTALFAALCLLLTGCGPSYTGGGIPVDVSENHEETAESSSASSSEAEEEEKAAYVWYLEPFLEAEDVNAVAEENADFNYGYHMDTALSVFQKDGRLGLIGNDGELITEAVYQNVTGAQDSENPHYGLTAPDTPGRDEVY